MVAGNVLAKDVAVVRSAKTVQGGDLRVGADHGITIKNANATRADVEATNGVIHVIDTVLLPALYFREEARLRASGEPGINVAEIRFLHFQRR